MSRRERKHFRRTVVLDFEYEIEDGGLPNVLCLVAYILDENLRHIETIRRWRGEFGTSPPFRHRRRHADCRLFSCGPR